MDIIDKFEYKIITGLETLIGGHYHKPVNLQENINVESVKRFFKENNDRPEDYCNEELCKSCKGECCKSMGCYIAPDELISVDYNTLKQLLDTGFVSIDWWEHLKIDDGYFERGYFIRMRNQNGDVVDPSWGGVCTALTENGCSFEFKYRPKGGRRLNPIYCKGKETENKLTYTKRQCAIDWIPYYNILHELAINLQ